jgi:hypothetical protein
VNSPFIPPAPGRAIPFLPHSPHPAEIDAGIHIGSGFFLFALLLTGPLSRRGSAFSSPSSRLLKKSLSSEIAALSG